MIRPAVIVCIGVIAVLAVALFLVSYRVQRLDKELAALDRQALAHQEAIHVLRAEWSYLNRPDRLADLSKRYLPLEPVNVHHVITADALDRLATIDSQSGTVSTLPAKRATQRKETAR
jgi:hypothetical protein